ncbi:hypothetical protein Ade02nite_29560 [Paractinoplanes deccanensis]|uniref:PH domain-containing protein n=1 Tax=Paractinoplanes deccanensis TaxID=113561 RepID=A0ABQ3Y2X1_9ACTN|nr:hypothetical protein [Actinoplanes deccanensis]GID74315.1 hypothetical protein Ade02nite_29560 [Actinoplanes deccanensis]
MRDELPEDWPRPPRSARRVLTAAGLVVFALLLVFVTVGAAADGDAGAALLLGAGAVLLAHVAGLSVSLLRRPRAAVGGPAEGVTDQGEKGRAFRYSRWPYYWLSVTLGAAVVLAAGYAVLLALGGTTAGFVVAALLGGVALFLGWFLVVLLRLAPGVIVVTPTGVYHRSLVLEHFVPWHAVTGVEAQGPEPLLVVKAMPTPDMRVRRHTGRLGAFEGQFLPFLVARAFWLGGNAVPAYEALRELRPPRADAA